MHSELHILKIKRKEAYEKSGFLNHKSRKKKKKLLVINCTFGITYNKRRTNLFKRYHRVSKNSYNKMFMEMSLSSLGRMLKSYFSRQQRRSRSSLFDTSTSFRRSCSRNCTACLRSIFSLSERCSLVN